MIKGDGAAIIAVDGGGTSATFVAADARGAELARTVTGPTSQKAVGQARAAAELARGFFELARMGAPVEAARVVVCGLSGYDSPRSARVQEAMLDEAGVPANTRVLVSDSLLPLFGAGLSHGAVMIAGTGSIAVGLDGAGGLFRAGGWGYEWSDAGSGHWMGARVLERALAYRDGACGPDALYEEALGIVGVRSFDELAWWAVDGPSPSEVARLAPAVVRGASEAARAVRSQAARALSQLYASLARSMRACGADAPADLVLAGGLFASDAFSEDVASRIASALGDAAPRIHAAEGEPVAGGVAMGRLALAGELPRMRPMPCAHAAAPGGGSSG